MQQSHSALSRQSLRHTCHRRQLDRELVQRRHVLSCPRLRKPWNTSSCPNISATANSRAFSASSTIFGFRKMYKSNMEDQNSPVYCQPLFTRDDPSHMLLIKRKTHRSKRSSPRNNQSVVFRPPLFTSVQVSTSRKTTSLMTLWTTNSRWIPSP